MLKFEKRNYEIIGLTPRMAKIWKKDFRDDLTIFENKKTGEIKARLALTLFEAFKMRVAMIRSNFKHSYVLKLRRYKGQRYGV